MDEGTFPVDWELTAVDKIKKLLAGKPEALLPSSAN